jgi:hypothetical protein
LAALSLTGGLRNLVLCAARMTPIRNKCRPTKPVFLFRFAYRFLGWGTTEEANATHLKILPRRATYQNGLATLFRMHLRCERNPEHRQFGIKPAFRPSEWTGERVSYGQVGIGNVYFCRRMVISVVQGQPSILV